MKEFFTHNMHNIRNLSGCNEIRTSNHLVHKRTLNDFTKLEKLNWWVKVVVYKKVEVYKFFSPHIRTYCWDCARFLDFIRQYFFQTLSESIFSDFLRQHKHCADHNRFGITSAVTYKILTICWSKTSAHHGLLQCSFTWKFLITFL